MPESKDGYRPKLDEGISTCGKDGQSVPIGVGMPTIKLEHFRELCRPGFCRYPTHSAEKRGMDRGTEVYSKSENALDKMTVGAGAGK
jgi:hypothetical protein